jgi:hypothetical protein
VSEYDKKSAIDSINRMQAEIDRLTAENASLKTPFGAIEKTHDLSYGKWSSTDLHKDYNWEKIEKSYEVNIPLAEANDAINARNARLLANLVAVITKTGFPSERKEWRRNKYVTVPNEWKSCLFIKYGDGRSSLDKKYAEYKQCRAKAIADHEQAERQARQQRDKDEQESRSKIAFVDLCRSIGLDPLTAVDDDIEDAIRAKCKYLNLAIAGIQTRNDWSDGCGRVVVALRSFAIVSPLDQEIVTEWSEICGTFEDGRSFRDCEHNYSKLMDMANPEVVAMWDRFQENRGRT